VIAYELLLGRVPFDQAEPPMAIMLRHLNDEIPPLRSLNPAVDSTLSSWVERMLAKTPTDRPGDAAEAAEELEEIVIRLLGPRWRRLSRLSATHALPDETSIPEPTSATAVLRPAGWSSRRRGFAWIAGLAAAISVLGGAGIAAAVALSGDSGSGDAAKEQTTLRTVPTEKTLTESAPAVLRGVDVEESGDALTASMRFAGEPLGAGSISLRDPEIEDGLASFWLRQKRIGAATVGGIYGPLSMRIRKGPGGLLVNVRATPGTFTTIGVRRVNGRTVAVELRKAKPVSNGSTAPPPADTTTTEPATKPPKKPTRVG
jgi:hypothetical protein